MLSLWRPESWHYSLVPLSRRARSPLARSVAFQSRVLSASSLTGSMSVLGRTRTRRFGGSIPMRVCRWRLPPSLKTGVASAIGKARKDGSITLCCPASARQWWSRSPKMNSCRCSGARTSNPLSPLDCNQECSGRSSPATAAGASSAEKALKATSGKNVCGAPIQTKKWTNSGCPTNDDGRESQPLKFAIPEDAFLDLTAQPHHNVNAGDLVAFRRGRRLADDYLGVWNVEHLILAFDEEMVVRSRVGIEIGF